MRVEAPVQSGQPVGTSGAHVTAGPARPSPRVRVLGSRAGQECTSLVVGVPLSELVAPLIVSALMLAGIGVATFVVLRRRRAARPPQPASRSGRASARSGLRRPDRGRDLPQRPEQLGILPLQQGRRERYLHAWEGVQTRLPVQPALALSEADTIVDRLLRERGYPVDDPREPTDVLPGVHAHVLANYRTGHALEQVNTSTRSDAVQVAQGMAHFRTAFDALLDEGSPYPLPPRRLTDGSATSGQQPGPG